MGFYCAMFLPLEKLRIFSQLRHW